MAKVKVKRKSTLIDMTAMSDVTVLLLTFFMLTSTFVQKEPVQVSTPSSVSEIKIPEINVLQVLVEPSGKIFISLDKQEDRVNVLNAMSSMYGVPFTPEQINKFRLANSFGVPIKQMPGFLDLKSDIQDQTLKNYGIPCANRDLKIAIKADQATPYDKIKNVMSSLQDIKENRYNLLTSLKTLPAEEEQ